MLSFIVVLIELGTSYADIHHQLSNILPHVSFPPAYIYL